MTYTPSACISLETWLYGPTQQQGLGNIEEPVLFVVSVTSYAA